MATITAAQSGDWSDTATWTGGVLPGASDIASANGFVVTIDQTVTTQAMLSTVNGGYFECNIGGITITTTTPCSSATESISSQNGFHGRNNGFRFDVPTGETLTIVGDFTGYYYDGSGIIIGQFTGDGTIDWTGDFIDMRASNSSDIGLSINGNLTVNHTGDILGGTFYSDTKFCYSMDIKGSAVYNLTGDYLSSATRGRISLRDSCEFNIVGNITHLMTNFDAIYIQVLAAPTITLNGTFTTSANMGIIRDVNLSSDLATINIVAGSTIVNTQGITAIFSRYLSLPNTGDVTWVFQTDDPYDDRTMYSDNQNGSPPDAADVRDGVGFATSLTGTCEIPAASNVRLDVPVDDGVGTAILTAPDVWDALISGLTVSGSIGERLKNAATVEAVGDQWAAG